MRRAIYSVLGPVGDPRWILRLIWVAIFTTAAPAILLIAAASDDRPGRTPQGLVEAAILVWLLTFLLGIQLTRHGWARYRERPDRKRENRTMRPPLSKTWKTKLCHGCAAVIDVGLVRGLLRAIPIIVTAGLIFMLLQTLIRRLTFSQKRDDGE